MLRLFDEASYDVLKHAKLAYIVTAAFAVPGLLLLALRGPNLSIEFTGGTLVEVRVFDAAVRTQHIRTALGNAGIGGAEIQTFGAPNEFVIRARLESEEVASATGEQAERAIEAALTNALGAGSFEVVRAEAIGPKVGGELRTRAQLALLLASGAIFIFIWFRYEWRFGLAAVLATVHDVFSTLAFISYMNLEVSLVVVAGLLTIIGYSLNDTIVTFDRVRENLRRFRRKNIYEILNRSINETLPRTILTSGTTLVATVALLLLAGKVISAFAWVMTFGIVTGTFSSIFIASPILLALERRWPGEDVRGAKTLTPSGATVIT